MPVLGGTRTSAARPTAVSRSGASAGAGRRNSQEQSSGAVDHWSAVLFYSMGFGTIAVGILFFAVLVMVFLYGQFVWSFTQWDLSSVRLTPFKSLAYLIVAGTFLGGTCVGLWCFSGAAWRKRTPQQRRR